MDTVSLTDISEVAILGLALNDSTDFYLAADRLSPRDFVGHRQIASAIWRLHAGHDPINLGCVAAELGRSGELQRMGGRAQLIEMADQAAYGEDSIKYHIGILRDRTTRNDIFRLGAAAQALSVEDRPIADIVADVEDLALSLGSHRDDAGTDLRTAVRSVMADIDKPFGDRIYTGIDLLDDAMGGLKPGSLTILGARPSMGKTAFALGIARNGARSGHQVAFFSLEMDRTQVAQRLLSMASGVKLARIVNRKTSLTEVDAMSTAANVLYRSQIQIYDRTAATVSDISSYSRHLKHRHGLGLVIVDYLQLMDGPGKSREQVVSSIARGLKRLAGQLDVPILCLCQLNRQLEQRQCKRPLLSDLRESGAIEQDADEVLFLWREAYYDDAADPTVAEVIIAKNRNGPTGYLPARWTPETATIDAPRRNP